MTNDKITVVDRLRVAAEVGLLAAIVSLFVALLPAALFALVVLRSEHTGESGARMVDWLFAFIGNPMVWFAIVAATIIAALAAFVAGPIVVGKLYSKIDIF